MILPIDCTQQYLSEEVMVYASFTTAVKAGG